MSLPPLLATLALSAVTLGAMSVLGMDRGLAALAALGLAALALSLARPGVALLAVLGLLLVAPFLIPLVGAPVYLSMVWGGLLFGTVSRNDVGRSAPPPQWADCFVALTLLMSLVDVLRQGAASGMDAKSTAFAVTEVAAMAAVYLLARRELAVPGSIDKGIRWLIAIATAQAVIGLAQTAVPAFAAWTQTVVGERLITGARNYLGYVLPVSRDVTAAYGSTGNHLLLGNLLVFTCPLTLALSEARPPGWPRSRMRLFTAVQAAGLIASFSRQNLIGLVPAVWLLCVLAPGTRRRWVAAGAALVAAVIAVGVLEASPLSEWYRAYEWSEGRNMWVRLLGWKEGLELLAREPLRLLAGGSFQVRGLAGRAVYESSAGGSTLDVTDSNSYLAVLIRQGLPGLVGLLGVIAALVRRAVALARSSADAGYRALGRGLLAGTVGLCAALFFDNKFVLAASLPKGLLLLAMALTIDLVPVALPQTAAAEDSGPAGAAKRVSHVET